MEPEDSLPCPQEAATVLSHEPDESSIIIIISGSTAQSLALASLTGFVTGILRCGLSAPRSTWSSHPDSTTRDI
jgi:hypothetical protein